MRIASLVGDGRHIFRSSLLVSVGDKEHLIVACRMRMLRRTMCLEQTERATRNYLSAS